MRFVPFILITLSVLLTACSAKNARKAAKKRSVQIRIDIPEKVKSKKLNGRKIVSKRASWGLSDPAVLGELNCFGVFVTYPEIGTHENNCKDSSGNLIAHPDNGLGLVSNGGTVSAEITVGSQRRFQVVAFKSTLATCPPFPGNWDTSIEQQMSYPFIIGDVVADIFSYTGEMVITINFDGGTPKIGECMGPLFDWQGPASGTAEWGSAAWGSATWGP